MKTHVTKMMVGAAAFTASQFVFAGTDVYFNPLTHSASVASPNHINELNTPWLVPAGISLQNLTSLSEIEADVNQSVIRVPAGTSSSMWDMLAFDPSGRYVFIPHETPFGAGLSRYDRETDTTQILFAGDLGGTQGDWSNDYGAFDPARWTPNNTVIVGEEWTAEGRIIEVLNPLADPADIEIRELNSIANVAHEGINFSEKYQDVIYFIDEWNSGAIYKFEMKKKGDYTKGQTFVLSVDDYNGDSSANWNEGDNETAIRTGLATWVPITDKNGNPLTVSDPFKNGPTADPRSNPDTRGGRAAADEVNGTPYGRPEDMEIGVSKNGNEMLYVAVTSEHAVYSFEILNDDKVMVRLMTNRDTPKNLGFPATTGVVNSPDNLAKDALGNIYAMEDAPNGSNVGGDVWFVRDTDNDGVAESMDHFMSIQVDGSEATGLIFNPANPTEFLAVVMHPDSTDITQLPDGFGDAIWSFDLTDVVPPTCSKNGRRWDDFKWNYEHRMAESTCSDTDDYTFVKLLERAANDKPRGRGKHWKRWK